MGEHLRPPESPKASLGAQPVTLAHLPVIARGTLSSPLTDTHTHCQPHPRISGDLRPQLNRQRPNLSDHTCEIVRGEEEGERKREKEREKGALINPKAVRWVSLVGNAQFLANAPNVRVWRNIRERDHTTLAPCNGKWDLLGIRSSALGLHAPSSRESRPEPRAEVKQILSTFLGEGGGLCIHQKKSS